MSGFMTLPSRKPDAHAMIETRPARKRLGEMVLSDANRAAIDGILLEHREAEKLRAKNLSPSGRVLLVGPPGTGKTCCAEAIANEMGVPFGVVRSEQLISRYLGDSAKNLRGLFDYLAQAQPSVVLFDEIDILGSLRGTQDSSAASENNRLTSALLVMMDSYRGRALLVATTNLDDLLDPALFRRFDECLCFEMPTRAQSWTFAHMKLMALTGVMPSDKHAERWTDLLGKLSFALIERVMIRAAKRYVLTGGVLTTLVEEAIAAETYATGGAAE